MTKKPPTFGNFEEIDAYVAKTGEKGLLEIREFVANRLQHSNDEVQHMFVSGWLALHDSLEANKLSKEGHELTRRTVQATETAAEAARESARTSGQSSRASMVSAVFALAALIVSIAAYFKGP